MPTTNEMNSKPEGYVAIQLAHAWGAKIFTTVQSTEHINVLKESQIELARIIDLSKEKLVDVLLQETAELGVDFILDCSQQFQISIKDMIRCLAVHGHIVFASHEVQVEILKIN